MLARKGQASDHGDTMAFVDIRLTKKDAETLKSYLEYNCHPRMIKLYDEIEFKIRRLWDAGHDQNALCKCEHPYYRHFDSWENMWPVGCKYCECSTFEE